MCMGLIEHADPRTTGRSPAPNETSIDGGCSFPSLPSNSPGMACRGEHTCDAKTAIWTRCLIGKWPLFVRGRLPIHRHPKLVRSSFYCCYSEDSQVVDTIERIQQRAFGVWWRFSIIHCQISWQLLKGHQNMYKTYVIVQACQNIVTTVRGAPKCPRLVVGTAEYEILHMISPEFTISVIVG